MRRHDMPVAPGCFERGVSAERGGNRFCFASMVGTGRITRICSPASIRGNAKPQFGLRVPAASAFPTLAARWTIAPRTAVERKLDPPAPLPNPAANAVWRRRPRRRAAPPLFRSSGSSTLHPVATTGWIPRGDSHDPRLQRPLRKGWLKWRIWQGGAGAWKQA